MDDFDINTTLEHTAPPGFSKEHSGYVIDIDQPGLDLTNFQSSPAYHWLSANNYYNARRFGFIPSYPPSLKANGAEFEPWEFVWIGAAVN